MKTERQIIMEILNCYRDKVNDYDCKFIPDYKFNSVALDILNELEQYHNSEIVTLKEQPIHTAKEWGRIRKFAKDQFKRGQEHSQQSRREVNDILECISKFDDTESLENKGRYFEVIQKDVRNLNQKT